MSFSSSLCRPIDVPLTSIDVNGTSIDVNGTSKAPLTSIDVDPGSSFLDRILLPGSRILDP